MFYKILITLITSFVILITGCSALEQVLYRPSISQGNYFTSNEVSSVHIGMTKQQVAYILGTPMMSDPFNTNIWFYVFRQQLSHESVNQHTLILTFDNNDVLTNVENKPALTK